MTKKLTEYEKELIGVILDYEKAYVEQQERVQIALLGETANTPDIVDFSRIKAALRMEDNGDTAVDVVLGYIRGEIDLEFVFGLVEIVMNGELEEFREWWSQYE